MNSIITGLHSLSDKLLGWLNAIIVSLPNLFLATIIFLVFWLLGRWAYNLISAIFKKTDFNRTLEHLLAATVKIIVICIGAVLALSVLQLEKTVFSMLAGVGVIGLALGFAFQDLASNFISGIMIAVRAPMRVGDVIKIGDVFGTVSDLRLRDTVVRNFEGQEIFIPNKSFMVENFSNFSVFGRRKIAVEVRVSYEDDMKNVTESVLQNLKAVDLFLREPPLAIYATAFSESHISMRAEGWIKYPGTDPDLAKHQMVISVKKTIDDKKFRIPYPSQIARSLGEEAKRP